MVQEIEKKKTLELEKSEQGKIFLKDCGKEEKVYVKINHSVKFG